MTRSKPGGFFPVKMQGSLCFLWFEINFVRKYYGPFSNIDRTHFVQTNAMFSPYKRIINNQSFVGGMNNGTVIFRYIATKTIAPSLDETVAAVQVVVSRISELTTNKLLIFSLEKKIYSADEVTNWCRCYFNLTSSWRGQRLALCFLFCVSF